MHQIIHCDASDHRLDVYRDLKFPKNSKYFVTEGRMLAERLLGSPYPTSSILVSQRRLQWVDEFIRQPEVNFSGPVYVVPNDEMDSIVGFEFHSGILAAGRRAMETSGPAQQTGFEPQTLESWIEARRSQRVLIALPHLDLADNLGSIIRSARAFGCDGLLLDERAPDPLSRRVLRVSMGHSLFMPIYQSPSQLANEIEELKRLDFEIVVVEVCERMKPLKTVRPSDRQVLVFGNEFTGIDPTWLDRADKVVGIPMAPGVDSLNVAVTVAIALHHYAG